MTGTFVSLDVETTGLDYARDEIIEIGVVVFTRDAILDRYSSLIRPTKALPFNIASLTGIDPKELKSARGWADVAREVRSVIGDHPIVGHSVSFDINMLTSADFRVPQTFFDTYQLASLLLHDQPSYALSSIAAELGVSGLTAHRALADAEMAALVFQRLLDRIDLLDDHVLADLSSLLRIAGMREAEVFSHLLDARTGGRKPRIEATGMGLLSAEQRFMEARDRVDPLGETGSHASLDVADLTRAMQPGGPLSAVVANFERRPQQEAMAASVATAFNEEQHLIVEAGTGTGKSMAYLLPAALHAVEHGEPVVVSTNTLALQDQLYRKDLPDVQASLEYMGIEEPVVGTVLKGRSNYLCLKRWFANVRTPTLDPAEARLRAKILIWLGTTETGDRAELRLERDELEAWGRYSEEDGACLPGHCPFHQRNQCFLYRARRRADAAHIVIVNHALLLSDVVTPASILPPFERLIVDEAHQLEEQATQQLGFVVGERDVQQAAERIIAKDGAHPEGLLANVALLLVKEGKSDADKARSSQMLDRQAAAMRRIIDLRRHAEQFFDALIPVLAEANRTDRTLRITQDVRDSRQWADAEVALDFLMDDIAELDRILRWAAGAIGALPEPDDLDAYVYREELAKDLEISTRDLEGVRLRLQSAVIEPNPDMVYWVQKWQNADRASLHAAPLEVGEALRESLFAPRKTVVLTSATLSTGGAFGYVQSRVGLQDAETMQVASPFDYGRSTLLYLPNDMPEPNAPGYLPALNESLLEAVTATEGRTLVLYTSYASMDSSARSLRSALEERGILLLVQGTDGSARQLIDRLRTTPKTVVFGTNTLWEGVDVIGPALSMVVITKLPFAVPTDPIVAARSELFEQPFMEYSVPQAVLRFKQGFGRLIRSGRDRGVCAVMDPRVSSKKYGKLFIASLPECMVQVNSRHHLGEAARAFLADGE